MLPYFGLFAPCTKRFNEKQRRPTATSTAVFSNILLACTIRNHSGWIPTWHSALDNSKLIWYQYDDPTQSIVNLQLACILHPLTMQNPSYFSQGDLGDMQHGSAQGLQQYLWIANKLHVSLCFTSLTHLRSPC